MDKEQDVRQSFVAQAEICKSLGSDFMDYLLLGLGERLDRSSEVGRQILDWPGDPKPTADALALRLAGGLHALVRRGILPDLESYYSLAQPLDATFMPLVMEAIQSQDDALLPFLGFAPQTNEVARSAIIYAGLLEITAQYGKPLSLFELGASGGLNLQAAQFGYSFDNSQFGEAHSPLQLTPDWQGGLLPNALPEIISRRGCDLNPLSVQEEKDQEKLIAYLWPDQPDRIKRVEAAIEIARASPPQLDKADAADWVESTFVHAETRGSVKVLYHTIAQNYFPKTVIARIKKVVEIAGEQASKDNPLAWLSFEFEGDTVKPQLILQTWPGGKRKVLAEADPHVYAINWK